MNIPKLSIAHGVGAMIFSASLGVVEAWCTEAATALGVFDRVEAEARGSRLAGAPLNGLRQRNPEV